MDNSEIEIPEAVPVMLLEDTILFPNAVLPLYIFEEQYRNMLGAVLEQDRMFAIFNRDALSAEADAPHPVGTVGVIRACHQNTDGTSNLVLQGLTRVRFLHSVQDLPYPVFAIEPLPTEPISEFHHAQMRDTIALLNSNPSLTAQLPEDYANFILGLTEPDVFIDVCAFSMVACANTRQLLLETTDIAKRFELLQASFHAQIHRDALFRELQGKTRDDEIDHN